MTRFLMSSVPKSGTHFMTEFYYKLKLKRHLIEDLQYRLFVQKPYEVDADDEMTEFSQQIAPLRQATIQAILSMPENQFVYNHYAYDASLLQTILKANIPIVFVVRDPRDYVVSLTNYVLRHRDHKHYQLFQSIKSNEERYLTIITGASQGKEVMLPINYLYKKMQGWIEDSRVFTLRFEEVIGPKGGGSREVQYRTFEKLVNHINYPINRDELYRQVDAIYNEQSNLFVKGQIGQWQEVFSDTVLETFNSHAGYLPDLLGYSQIELSQSEESKVFNAEDIRRLKACLENSERDFLQGRQSNIKEEALSRRLEQDNQAKQEEICTLLEKLDFLEKESQKRLEEIQKKDEEIARLRKVSSSSIWDKILGKLKQ